MKTPGAFDNPKSIKQKLNSPMWQAKTAFSWSTSSKATCQNPDHRSRGENQEAFPNSTNISLMKSRDKTNGFVTVKILYKICGHLTFSPRLISSRGIWIIQSPLPPTYLSQLLPLLLS